MEDIFVKYTKRYDMDVTELTIELLEYLRNKVDVYRRIMKSRNFNIADENINTVVYSTIEMIELYCDEYTYSDDFKQYLIDIIKKNNNFDISSST